MSSPQRLRNTDLFVLCNVCLFLFMCYFTYYERFIHYRGKANTLEFFLYAAFIIAGILSLRRILDRYTLPTYLLVLAQIGICIHFTGGLVIVEGKRVYDLVFFGVRYDKYVHFYNAYVAAVCLRRLPWAAEGLPDGFRDLLLFTCVLGFGAVIEIAEYLVTLTVLDNGVGSYDNNMCDLIANALGAGTYLMGSRVLTRFRRRPSTSAEAALSPAVQTEG